MSLPPPRSEARLTVLLGAFATAALACAGCVRPIAAEQAPDPCAEAGTPDAVGQCVLAEATRLEAELAEEEAGLAGALEAESGGETGTGRSLLEEFRRAQQAWQQYRDAQCSYAYATALGGDLRGLKAATCLRELMRERVARVRAEREQLQREQLGRKR